METIVAEQQLTIDYTSGLDPFTTAEAIKDFIASRPQHLRNRRVRVKTSKSLALIVIGGNAAPGDYRLKVPDYFSLNETVHLDQALFSRTYLFSTLTDIKADILVLSFSSTKITEQGLGKLLAPFMTSDVPAFVAGLVSSEEHRELPMGFHKDLSNLENCFGSLPIAISRKSFIDSFPESFNDVSELVWGLGKSVAQSHGEIVIVPEIVQK